MQSYERLQPARQKADLDIDLTDDEWRFFEQRTGTTDRAAIGKHISRLQKTAYQNIFPYPQIRSITFARFKLSNHPAWPTVLAQGIAAKSILLDLGCCFGTDIRRCVGLGYPVDRILGAELLDDFVQAGYKLFMDAPDENTTPHIVVGDIFGTKFLDPNAPDATTVGPLVELSTLTPLKNQVRHLHAGSFFHLFDQALQTSLASLLAKLVSNEPGSIIFGSHVSQPQSGFRGVDAGMRRMYCFNPEDFSAMWEKIYGKDKVRVKATLVDTLMTWSVELL